ncbi:FAD-dependent oxidoreductase [Dongia soli]|uniref:FAD-dependent oxidoreductase n=1 Tax=Dongia soli TaxID=600628 RepID=A0ABU5EC37_9PROT|nr:FAD-dependent oxidoreductase [Dongia soli]MDY0883921.1 FAD-dependent oxidoreductase [Dongia soli]
MTSPGSSKLPKSARVVIVGGGIAGVSVAYHLTKLGWREVLLLEQGQLTCGTTWHAAGLVGQLRANRSMTRMSMYGTQLYAELERETGLATGWKKCGSITVARTADRLTQLKRSLASAKSFGLEAEFITPAEAGKLFPLMRTDDLAGAVWLPNDGKANPTDLTQSLAKGARMGGAQIVEGVKVTGVRLTSHARPQVIGVSTEQGNVDCDYIVNCAGQWAREFGQLAGVNVPLYSAEHFYLVTGKIDGVHPDLPVVRDPDGYIYFKEEVGGLVMGGFEPKAKPWDVARIPDKFEFQLLSEDWDQFEILMQNALQRTPCLESAEIKQLLNGPESFTADGNFILGEAPEVANYFVCAGFNSAGIANSGGAGRLTAEWIVDGGPSQDLWDVDIRRLAAYLGNRRFLRERTVESLGLHYAMRYPRQELQSARPLRRSPLYDRLQARGARFGSRMGWERANYFAPLDAAPARDTFGKPDWLPYMLAEQRAAREAAAIFDQSSFSKFLLQGREALSVLQKVCANQMNVAVDRMVYTAMLNERGGFESDLTVIRVAPNSFLIITGTAQTTRDFAWIESHIADAHAVLTDVTSAYGVLSLMGPRSSAILARVSPEIAAGDIFSGNQTRMIDVGPARIRAAQIAYIGGAGFELYVPSEMMATIYETLEEAGHDLGLADGGYYTIDALRVEAGRRAFGSELGPDETPLEAGLMYAVKMEKGSDFIGRAALQEQEARGTHKRLAMFTVDDSAVFPWGGEILLRDGAPVGEVSSAGYSACLGRAVVMGYVRSTAPIDTVFLAQGRYQLNIAGEIVPLTRLTRPAYPPR